jgi:hypothetical protein
MVAAKIHCECFPCLNVVNFFDGPNRPLPNLLIDGLWPHFHLPRLIPVWEAANHAYHGGVLVPPISLLAEPSHPRRGRSAVMAGSLLVLTGHSPQGAFELLSAARGLNVPEPDEQQAWVEAFARHTQA